MFETKEDDSYHRVFDSGDLPQSDKEGGEQEKTQAVRMKAPNLNLDELCSFEDLVDQVVN